MFYAKPLKFKKTSYYNVDFTSFSLAPNTTKDQKLMPFARAYKSYNFDATSGALECGNGFADLKMPMFYGDEQNERTILMPNNVEIKKVWHYKYYNNLNAQKEHMVLFYCSDNKVYYSYVISISNVTFPISTDLSFTSTPTACNYRLGENDVMIFTSPTDNMTVFCPELELQVVESAPKIEKMCVHNERLFAVTHDDKQTLRFSDDLNPTNWTSSLTEGGSISFADGLGDIGEVVSFGDYLYLVRDYGITRLSTFGSQSDFCASNVFCSSAKIFANSCANCGDCLMFLSKDGVFAFDGSSAQKIDLGVDELFEGMYNENAAAAFYRGKYFLACRLNFDEGQIGCEYSTYQNNALIEIDLLASNFNITRGVDICSLASVEEANASKLVACFGSVFQTKLGQLTNDGCLFGEPLEKLWQSPKTNLGHPNKKKFIRDLIISTTGPISVQIEADDATKTYQFSGSLKPQVVHPKMVCENVKISFSSCDETCHISWPRAVVGIVG